MSNHAAAIAILSATTMMAMPAAGQTVPRPDLSEWVGEWKASEEQSISVTMPDKKGLQFDGFATYGALDPERVANGSVHVGEFSVRVPSSWITVDNTISFALGLDGEAVPPETAGEFDCVLEMRLDWNINWIDVTDNRMCGGHNVSFTGQYEWVE